MFFKISILLFKKWQLFYHFKDAEDLLAASTETSDLCSCVILVPWFHCLWVLRQEPRRPESAFPFSPAQLIFNIKSEIVCSLCFRAVPFSRMSLVKNMPVVTWVLLPSADCRAHLREPKFPKFAWPSGDLLCPLCSLVLGTPTCPRAWCRDYKCPQKWTAGTWSLFVLPKAVTSFFWAPRKISRLLGCSGREARVSPQWETCSPWLSVRYRGVPSVGSTGPALRWRSAQSFSSIPRFRKQGQQNTKRGG